GGNVARAEDDLHQARCVAKVDEDDAAEVAAPGDPSGQHDRRAGVLATECGRLAGTNHSPVSSTVATRSSRAIVFCSPVASHFSWTTPLSRSRSPTTAAYAAPDRSAAFIAPFNPRSP